MLSFNHFLSFSNNESSFTDEFSKGLKEKGDSTYMLFFSKPPKNDAKNSKT